MAAETTVGVSVFESFDELALEATTWNDLLRSGSTDVPFLTFEWQRAWWEAFGGDRLLVAVAERHGRPYAIAPLFALDEMLFFVGSGGSDYLDFIGHVDGPTLTAMLDAVRRRLTDLVGIKLFHVPVHSSTTALLPGLAASLDLELFEEGRMSAPYLDLTDPVLVSEVIDSRRLRKEEARMRRGGPLAVRTARAEDLDPWLDAFFSMHATQWRPLGEAGLESEDARSFCRSVVHGGHLAGWLRLSMLEWRGKPAAFDLSLIRGSRQLTYLVSRDVSIREYSPGKILERHVISAALETGAQCFDLGLGEEEYKLRHASGATEVVDWSLYP